MKRIIFPATNRVHLARQQLLISELKKSFEVDVWQPKTARGPLGIFSIIAAIEFNNYLASHPADLVLIRGDRAEMLGLAMVSLYRGLKIAHIEAGDLSGRVCLDDKIRHAVSRLADIHFATNDESLVRAINMGAAPTTTWNLGSLDVSFAKSCIRGFKVHYFGKKYIVVCHHPLVGEDVREIEKGLKGYKGRIIRIKSNSDQGIAYGNEEYEPEKYIRLLAGAECLVGNSSSFLKEASIFGTPVLNLGGRQASRLKPHNVLDVPVSAQKIRRALRYQLSQGRYDPSLVYYKPDTEREMRLRLEDFLA